jgi:hypothetical protein
MVLGNLIQLNSVGHEDRYLYGNPQMTYFKSVYKRASNFAVNYSKVPFIGNVNVGFGKEIKFNIPFKADLLGALYFKIKFSDLTRQELFKFSDGTTTNKAQFTSYVNGIGYNCFDYIKLYINGNLIQTIDSKLIYLLNELNNDYTKKRSFYSMNLFEKYGFSVGNDNKEDVNTTLLVPFFFSRDTSFALPLCALTHSDIQLVVKFKEASKCIIQAFNTTGDNELGINGYNTKQAGGNTVGDFIIPDGPNGNVPAQFEQYTEIVNPSIESFEVFSENIYLDDNEKKMFLNRELTYLIELYFIGNMQRITEPMKDITYTMDLESKNPTKYIAWYLQREDVLDANYYDNNTYDFPIKYSTSHYHVNRKKHILNDAILSLNNNDINDNVDAKFLSDVQLYQKFGNSSEGTVYVLSFALNPRKDEPTGTINFSRILYKSLKLTLVDEKYYTNNNFKPNILFNYYSSYYNILSIKDGLGGLMYQ